MRQKTPEQLAMDVPLTAEETDVLQTTLNWRIKIYGWAYVCFFFLAFYFALGGGGRTLLVPKYYSAQLATKPVLGETEPIVETGQFWIGIIWLESIVIGTGIFFYRRNIRPLRRDLKSGVKLLVQCTITRKEHFPITDQYFLFTDNAKCISYEVVPEQFETCQPGDILYIPCAKYSGTVFRLDGRVSL